MISLKLPLSQENIQSLHAGDMVSLTGEIYTARDAAHKRLYSMLNDCPMPADATLPFGLDGKAVYYAGPCPAPPGLPIGSIGPTTSSRMDKYAPLLISNGMKIMIGKGERSRDVVRAIKEYKGLYLTAVGGAGAYYARCVTKCETVAFEDLGSEAIHKLDVRDMQLVVAIDCQGNSIFRRVI